MPLEIGQRLDYHDARIAALYDLANPLDRDAHFYVSLAGHEPRSVLDLGCGTGTLCCALAERGHSVRGVDPAPAMLALARTKPASHLVEWVESSAQKYRSCRRFDFVFMTGHAFQVLLSDADIQAVLDTMRYHLEWEGTAVFDTRNPSINWIEEWEGRSRTLGGSHVVETLKVTAADANAELLSFETSYCVPDTTLVTSSTLRFASPQHLEQLISRSELVVEQVLGDWEIGRPFDPAFSREMIFLLRARQQSNQTGL